MGGDGVLPMQNVSQGGERVGLQETPRLPLLRRRVLSADKLNYDRESKTVFKAP